MKKLLVVFFIGILGFGLIFVACDDESNCDVDCVQYTYDDVLSGKSSLGCSNSKCAPVIRNKQAGFPSAPIYCDC